MSALGFIVGVGGVCTFLAIAIVAVVALSSPNDETPRWVVMVCGWLFTIGGALCALGVLLGVAMIAIRVMATTP